METPVRIEEYSILKDTGGPGKYRGSLSQVRRVRCLVDDSTLQIRSDKRRYRAYGLHGGKEGEASWNILNPGDGEVVLPTLSGSPMQRGDVILHLMASGGGWGDPMDRDPERVRADVWNEKMSIEHARREYGVAIDPETLQVDTVETERLRDDLRHKKAAGDG